MKYSKSLKTLINASKSDSLGIKVHKEQARKVPIPVNQIIPNKKKEMNQTEINEHDKDPIDLSSLSDEEFANFHRKVKKNRKRI